MVGDVMDGLRREPDTERRTAVKEQRERGREREREKEKIAERGKVVETEERKIEKVYNISLESVDTR